LDDLGTLYCWGAIAGGWEVKEIAQSVKSIDFGAAHQCMVTTQDEPYCWGRNDAGQVGDGTKSNQLDPVPVATDSSMARIAAGGSQSCGVTPSGQVQCWGWGQSIGWGNGRSVYGSTVPVPSAMGLPAAGLAMGLNQACILEPGGSISCWTSTPFGAVGSKDPDRYWRPIRLEVNTTFVSLDAGREHACALDDGGTVWCWGRSPQATDGDGFIEGVAVLDGAVSIGTGLTHSCAVTATGAVYCWGYGLAGELGRQGVLQADQPILVDTHLPFESVVGGKQHTCARTAAGEAYCWGGNGAGAVGIPFLLESEVPVQTLPF
jgi:alpha-tubulin suppressor-like RCC1 family protein